jgi:predicted choloylglycine hydrolase
MLSHLPVGMDAELRAMAEAADVSYDQAALAQMFADLTQGEMLFCSSLAASTRATQDGHVLLARNLDFPSFGLLEHAAVVLVYHPQGGQAFATVGFPGVIGAITGVNEKGLALACHAVAGSQVNAEAMPYLILLRQVLAECGTVEEAIELFSRSAHSTSNNFLLVDRGGRMAVVEVSSRRCNVRRLDGDTQYCTNFHAAGLPAGVGDARYRTLASTASEQHGRLTVASLQKTLHEVRLSMTVQSMVFDLTAGRLYLAAGEIPSSAGPYVQIDLNALWTHGQAAGDG